MSNNGATSGNAGPRNVLLPRLLIVSVTLNMGLVVWLLRPVPEGAAPRATITSTSALATAVPAGQAGISDGANLHGLPRPPLDWRQVESADYRQYAANLRAIGCPEETIRDIIVADMNQLYAVRARAIWPGQPTGEFWQKPRTRAQPSPDQIERLRTLEQEKHSMIGQVIGARVRGQELANTLLLLPDTTRASLAFLPEDKREAAYGALCDADLAAVSRSEHTGKDVEQPQDRQVAALSGILSSDELEEFRMRINPSAAELRDYLPYFECTPDEFKALVKLREEMRSATNASNDPYVRIAAEAAAFGLLFGEERGREYARKTDLFYIWARRAAERYGLPDDAADRAWEIKRDAIAAVQQFHADATLTATERRRLVEALHSATEAALVEVLGAKGTIMAKLGDWWLQFPTMEMSP